MPRPLTLLMSLGLVLMALFAAGCGGGDEEGAGEAATGAPEGPSTVQQGTLTVGSDIPFPPFEFREGDDLTGFDVELTEAMAERLGLDVRWVDTSFDTIFTSLAAGQFDMVASATTITPEREQQVNFTEPYYAAQQSLTVNTGESADVASVEDLQSGDVVAVQRGTTGERWARENVPEGVDVRSFAEAPDTYTALEAGNVEGVIFDEPSAVAEVAQRENLEIVQTIDTGERYGFAVNPRNEELLTALDEALAEIKQDGTYQEIYDSFEDLPEGGNVLQVEETATPAPAG